MTEKTYNTTTHSWETVSSGTSARPQRGRPEPTITGEKEEATLKWYNPEKKFGFVVSTEKGDDVFLHVSAIEASGIDAADLDRGTKLFIWRGIGRNNRESVVKLELASAT